MRYISGPNGEWPAADRFPGSYGVSRSMQRICSLTDRDPARAIKLAERLVGRCENDEETDEFTLNEAHALLQDARNALAKLTAIANPDKASGSQPSAVLGPS